MSDTREKVLLEELADIYYKDKDKDYNKKNYKDTYKDKYRYRYR
jgi:hypothetical protein